jgi:hypothetical protein
MVSIDAPATPVAVVLRKSRRPESEPEGEAISGLIDNLLHGAGRSTIMRRDARERRRP